MIEDELRAAFARHESLTPDAGPVRAAINNQAVRRRRRRRLGIRAAGAALAVLVVVSVPALVRTLAPAPRPAQVGGAPAPPVPTAAVPDSALNFLLLGIDGEIGPDSGNRADSVLIVHVPRDRSRLYLIALPRDLRLEIPGQGLDKLGSAFFYGSQRAGAKPDLAGGAKLTERAVSEMTGIDLNGTATMTFSGLRRVTDAVGGVELCLDQRVRSQHTSRTFKAGCQQIDGAAALDLLRQRYDLTEGAHDRDRNAERFAKALLTKMTDQQNRTDPARVLAIIRAASDGLVLDTGGMSPLDLLGSLRDVGAAEPVGIGWKFRSQRVNGTAYEQLDPAVSKGLFDAVRRDSLAEWTAANPGHVTR